MTTIFFKWVNTHKLHFIGWTLFIFFESTLIGLASGFFGKPLNYLLHFSLNISLFYFNAHVVLKLSFRKKEYSIIKVSILMISQIITYLIFRTIINQVLNPAHYPFNLIHLINDYQSLCQSLWRGLQFIGFSSFYYLFLEYKNKRNRLEKANQEVLLNELKTEKIQNELHIAEYEYLKAQINPHLLFNTLSFLYNSIRKHDEKAGEAVLNLAELMRFSIETKESREKFPALQEELKQIDNLITLNKLRKDSEQYIDLEYSHDVGEFRFIPLVLITLLENMIKHGNLKKQDEPGVMRMNIDGNMFSLSTTNLIKTKVHYSGFNKGMENIEKRLKLAYGNKFVFQHGTREGKYFDVFLRLNISL